MTRHEQRVCIFQAAFQIPFHDGEVPRLDLFEEYNGTEKDETYINKKVRNIEEKLDQIDESIEKHASGWKVNRIGKTELAILRVAVYEIMFDDDIPGKVAVNEAIELAKEYSDDKSASFINGVLSGFIEE
ncbi:MAG: transcription antitermination factor NusB [Eubacterium sp.]|nr:transcription antitermination factor NusB [Eubacterium sp.]